MYHSLLTPLGFVRLKTDAHALFNYSVESFAAEGWENASLTKDLHNSTLLAEHQGVTTDYEQMALRK